MTDKALGNGTITAAGALTGAEKIHVVQGGNSRETTTQEIGDLGTPSGAEIVAAIDVAIGNAEWRAPLTDAEVVAAVNAELGGTAWQAPLTNAAVVAAIDAELGNAEWKLPEIVAINAERTTGFTLALTDAGDLNPCNFASPGNVTVPPNSSVAFPVRSRVHLYATGAGQVSVVAGSGVTVRTAHSLNMRAQYSIATLLKIATDEWLLFGDLEAAA